MEKIKKMPHSLQILILLALVAFFLKNVWVTKLGSLMLNIADDELSERQVQVNITRIARQYKRTTKLQCIVYTNENRGGIGVGDDFDKIQNMSDQERHYVLTGGDSWSKNLEPFEVYGLFECHLFLYNRKYPVVINAIAWSYNSGGLDNTRWQKTSITPDEFETILEQVDIEGLTNSEAAKLLGDYWIQQTGYVKLS